jgi:DNA-3-methyladenine glycosylase
MEKQAKVKRKSPTLRSLGRPLPRSFFEAPPETVAPRLLGKILAHRGPRGLLAGRIIEVEAYLGPHNAIADRAAHAHRGPTERNRVLFGPAGHAYVYFIYGMYFCMNVSCEPEGLAGGVLLRALEPLAGIPQMARNRGLAKSSALHRIASGPGMLCQAMGITRETHNGIDLTRKTSPLQILDDGAVIFEPHITARIGIRHAADLPLRFIVPAPHGHAARRTSQAHASR